MFVFHIYAQTNALVGIVFDCVHSIVYSVCWCLFVCPYQMNHKKKSSSRTAC